MKSLSHLNKYFRKYKYRFIGGIFFVTISNLFAVFPAQVIRYSFDIVESTINNYHLLAGFSFQTDYIKIIGKALTLFAVVVIAMAIIKGIFMFFMRQTIIVMSRLIEYDLKNEVFEHYQKLSLSFYKRNNTGDLMNRISEDVSRVRMYLGPAIMYTINLAVLFVLVIFTMVSVNAKLTLYCLLPLPVLSFLIYYVSDIINKKSEKVQRQLSNLSTFVQESFSGIRVLKAYSREKYFGKIFEKEAENYKSISLELVKTDALFQPIMMLLIGLSTILTIFIGGKLTIDGEITAGNIAEFVIYVNMLTWPVASVGWVTSLVQRAAASQERINEFLKLTPEISNSSEEETEINGKIEFKNLSFVYPDSGITALKNVSFTINPGETLAIVGKTGSGKSTIANLITRLYNPTSGNVFIDDKDITTINLNTLRSNTGYVPQEVFLFSDTIANNITFGVKADDVDFSLIQKASSDASVYDNINEFPKKFDTMLGERGITLSGGQKQRVSIARAIIRNPKILVFDDCLSAVDTQTEEHIINSLKNIMKNKTSIIISHRISTVKHADKIIVLENGEIAEEGTHEELLSANGIYAGLYKKQLLEEEKIYS
jgi:ATP-binding cassette, subfamily B, multidrug efflux pump